MNEYKFVKKGDEDHDIFKCKDENCPLHKEIWDKLKQGQGVDLVDDEIVRVYAPQKPKPE